MPICLDVLLAADRYDAAAGQDPRAIEWPPSPARVLSALRSAAKDEDLPALRLLERLPPPVVHASDAVSEGRSRAYVVTNTLAASGGNLTHVGRTSGLKERRSAFPLNPRLQFIWASDEAPDEIVAQLDRVARRVPYLGRSTSIALMGVRRVEEVRVPDGLTSFVPCPNDETGLRLRVPYPGFIDELDALYQEGLSAWQASDGARASHPYRAVPGQEDEPSSVLLEGGSPYGDLVVLRFRDRKPAGRLTATFTAALRAKVMGQTQHPLPPALHGHGFDGNPHVAYLGLPVSGHDHADGHLVGLAVAIPGMSVAERKRILRGILGPDGDGEVELKVPGFRDPFWLDYRPTEALPRSATASYWTRKSAQWVTATPVVLDRYPKDGDLAYAVMQSVLLAGLPEPAEVEACTAALTPGAVTLSPRELPKRARGRLYCHARITFDHEITGPVLVGAGRYFGVGLFLPEHVKKGGPDHEG